MRVWDSLIVCPNNSAAPCRANSATQEIEKWSWLHSILQRTAIPASAFDILKLHLQPHYDQLLRVYYVGSPMQVHHFCIKKDTCFYKSVLNARTCPRFLLESSFSYQLSIDLSKPVGMIWIKRTRPLQCSKYFTQAFVCVGNMSVVLMNTNGWWPSKHIGVKRLESIYPLTARWTSWAKDKNLLYNEQQAVVSFCHIWCLQGNQVEIGEQVVKSENKIGDEMKKWWSGLQ